MTAVQEKIALWRKWDRNQKTLQELDALVAADNTAELTKRFAGRLEFGTAGLRAHMGVGFACMNQLTVIQAAQGLLAYLQATAPAELAAGGIVVGFDARFNSKDFAALTATIFREAGVTVRLFPDIVPTPYVPYAILKYKCCAGVMVTASHNPKDDNGYKVYWGNGAQIIPPHDSGIAACIQEHEVPRESSWSTVAEPTPGLMQEVGDAFFASLAATVGHKEHNAATPLRFVYTAMHGVGTAFTQRAVETFGFAPGAFIPVEAQCTPDPTFPTVAFPNPEEGKSSLDLAMRCADDNAASMILANDPDADRLAVAEKAAGSWRVFTGNELGALFGWWAVHRAEARGLDLAQCCCLSSAVSGGILRDIAAKKGFYFEETLTGFKWMGSRSAELAKEGKTTLFAFEEAIGFMVGDRVLDKDGVTAAGAMAELAEFCRREYGRTLGEQLVWIYGEYGRRFSNNSYVISRDPAKTRAVFADLRSATPSGYPTEVAGASVVGVRDLGCGYDTATADRKAVLPTSAASPMLTLTFDNGVKMTVRGSGTEPKLKWYSEIVTDDTAMTQAKFDAFVAAAVDALIQPDQRGFERRPTE